MSSPDPGTGPKKHVPFVPETMEMKEFTLRAVLLGLFMTVVLGAANAYLGLRAGITIAATYPAAVIAMAAMRAWKGSLLEENIARTAGSIGESVAAGAIFTLPAFVIGQGVAVVPSRRRLLEIHGADSWWAAFSACCSFPWCGEAWWKIPNCPSRNRWPRRRFTRPGNAARKRRNISSGTSASAEWSTSSESSACSPLTPIFTLALAAWAAVRYVLAPPEARMWSPPAVPACSPRRA